MTAPHSSPLTSDVNPQQPADAQFYRRVLHELIEMGVDMARTVHSRVTASAANDHPEAETHPADIDGTQASVAFERISRAVRRSIWLARQLDQPSGAQPAVDESGPTSGTRAAMRRRVIRDVEDAIQRVRPEPEAEAYRAELRERMDGPDVEDDIGHRPVDEIVADICRDLGLVHKAGHHPWQRRTPADVDALYAHAAEPPIAGDESGLRPRPRPSRNSATLRPSVRARRDAIGYHASG